MQARLAPIHAPVEFELYAPLSSQMQIPIWPAISFDFEMAEPTLSAISNESDSQISQVEESAISLAAADRLRELHHKSTAQWNQFLVCRMC